MIAPDLAEKFDGQSAGGRRSPSAAAYDVHDVRGRRRHLPRPLPHPRPARADADQDDPRDLLTRALHQRQRRIVSGIDPDLPTPVRHGIALTQLIETYPAEKLPKTGGCSATVVVTMTLEQLTGRPRPRRGVHPGHRRPHLRSRSPPARLHRRDHPRRPRRARARSSTSAANADCTPKPCASPWACATAAAPPSDCETPPGLCHAHHDTPWSHGGHTSVDDRPPALPPPPPPHPRPPATRPDTSRRQGQLPPTDVDRRCLSSGGFDGELRFTGVQMTRLANGRLAA